MTHADQLSFTDGFAGMCEALQGGRLLRESPGLGLTYWQVLQDLDIEAVLAGMRRAAREWTGQRTLPRPAELRTYCDEAQRQAFGSAPAPAVCLVCSGDTWEPGGRECAGFNPDASTNPHPDSRCQRTTRHSPHTYAVRCRCWRGHRSE